MDADETLRRLESLAGSGDSTTATATAPSSACGAIVALMASHEGSAAVQQAGCAALLRQHISHAANTSQHDDDDVGQVLQSTQAMSRALTLHVDDTRLHETALHTWWGLVLDGAVVARLGRDATVALVLAVARAMGAAAANSDSAEAQRCGCAALWHVAASREAAVVVWQDAAAQDAVIGAVEKALAAFGAVSSDVARYACAFLESMCELKHVAVALAMARPRLVDLVVMAIGEHATNELVLEHATNVLRRFATDTAATVSVGTAPLIRLLVRVMRTVSGNASVVHSALAIVDSTLQQRQQQQIDPDMVFELLQVTNSLILFHRTSDEVIGAGLAVLATLIQTQPSTRSRLALVGLVDTIRHVATWPSIGDAVRMQVAQVIESMDVAQRASTGAPPVATSATAATRAQRRASRALSVYLSRDSSSISANNGLLTPDQSQDQLSIAGRSLSEDSYTAVSTPDSTRNPYISAQAEEVFAVPPKLTLSNSRRVAQPLPSAATQQGSSSSRRQSLHLEPPVHADFGPVPLPPNGRSRQPSNVSSLSFGSIKSGSDYVTADSSSGGPGYAVNMAEADQVWARRRSSGSGSFQSVDLAGARRRSKQQQYHQQSAMSHSSSMVTLHSAAISSSSTSVINSGTTADQGDSSKAFDVSQLSLAEMLVIVCWSSHGWIPPFIPAAITACCLGELLFHETIAIAQQMRLDGIHRVLISKDAADHPAIKHNKLLRSLSDLIEATPSHHSFRSWIKRLGKPSHHFVTVGVFQSLVQKGVFTLDSGAVITGVLSTDPTFFPYKLVRTSIPQQIVSQLQRALLMDPRNGLAPTEWIVLRALVQLQAISRVLEGLAPAQQNAAVQSLQVILSTETKRSMIPSLLTFISSGGNGRLAAASTSSVLSSDVAATVVNQVILQDWNCSTRVWAASTSRDDRVDFTAEFLDETKCACLSSNYVPPDAASLDQRFVTASETWEDFGGWYGYDWFSQDAWQYTSSRRLSGSKFYSDEHSRNQEPHQSRSGRRRMSMVAFSSGINGGGGKRNGSIQEEPTMQFDKFHSTMTVLDKRMSRSFSVSASPSEEAVVLPASLSLPPPASSFTSNRASKHFTPMSPPLTAPIDGSPSHAPFTASFDSLPPLVPPSNQTATRQRTRSASTAVRPRPMSSVLQMTDLDDETVWQSAQPAHSAAADTSDFDFDARSAHIEL